MVMALSPSALRSAVWAHSPTFMSMCEIWIVASDITRVTGMTTVASAASTVSVVARPPWILAFSRL